MASRDKLDVVTFGKDIQYALEKLGKSKFGFESTRVSNLKAKATEALGTSLLIIPELRVLVLTKRHVGSGNEIAAKKACQLLEKFRMLFPVFSMNIHLKNSKHLKTRPEVTELIETEEFSPEH